MRKIIFLASLIFFSSTGYAMPNPAAVNCDKEHGRYVNLQDLKGNSWGFCVFSDNSYCSDWGYFRHECSPGKFYWPEKKIDMANLKKYCVDTSKKPATVILCHTKDC